MCRLQKSLYILKQELITWYSRIGSYLLCLGFTKSDANPILYYIVSRDNPLILVL